MDTAYLAEGVTVKMILRWGVPVLAAAALLVPAAAERSGDQPGGKGAVRLSAGRGEFRVPARGVVLGGVGCPKTPCRARLAATADGGARWHFLAARAAVNLTGADVGARVTPWYSRPPGTAWLYGPALWSTHDGGAHWRKLSPGGAIKSMAAAAGRAYAVRHPAPGGHGTELFRQPGGPGRVGPGRPITVAPFTGLTVSGTAAWLGQRPQPPVGDRRRDPLAPVPVPLPGALQRRGPDQHHRGQPLPCLLPLPERRRHGAARQGRAVLDERRADRAPGRNGADQRCGGRDRRAAAPPPGRHPRHRLQPRPLADGGKTWSAKYVGTGGDAPWNSLAYVSRTVGWAEVGSPPYSGLLRTTDAGRTWHQVRF